MKKKRMIKIVLIALFSGLVLFLILFTFLNSKKYKKETNFKIDLIDNLNVEVNEQYKVSKFIKKIENGKMINKDFTIDSTKLGKQKISIQIECEKKVYDYSFEVEIIDTIAPVINAKDEFSTLLGQTIDLYASVVVTDNSKEKDNNITIEGNYDFNAVGNYSLVYVAVDKSGNKSSKPFTLRVSADPNNRTITTSKGYNLTISNGVSYINGILIVNKTYTLPSSYGNGLTAETLNSFNNMKADASAIGLNLYNSSGYRSYYDQKYIYDNYVKRDGQANADRYSARAGHSEHQSGLAFDLNTISWEFENTNEGIWVNQNCYKYGFILRYPKGKESITGYMFEPWHLRYVGVELAKTLYNNGNWITLEEYFGIDSKYS